MTEPIPLTIQCTLCGHPTMEFAYWQGIQEFGGFWRKRTIPPCFMYRCRTCCGSCGLTREDLGGHPEVRSE